MQGIFQAFDTGFFDLIIADESPQLYNRCRDLFRYFDALQIGLTATPVEFITGTPSAFLAATTKIQQHLTL